MKEIKDILENYYIARCKLRSRVNPDKNPEKYMEVASDLKSQALSQIKKVVEDIPRTAYQSGIEQAVRERTISDIAELFDDK